MTLYRRVDQYDQETTRRSVYDALLRRCATFGACCPHVCSCVHALPFGCLVFQEVLAALCTRDPTLGMCVCACVCVCVSLGVSCAGCLRLGVLLDVVDKYEGWLLRIAQGLPQS